MRIFNHLLAGSAGLAALVAAASPAAAQYYPQQQQPYNNGGILGQIINSVTGGGYGQYPQGNFGYGQVSQRTVVAQCAAAAEQRLNGGYRNQGYGGYNGGYQNNGYGYQNVQGGARVVGITNVERRNNGGLRVSGLASTAAHEQHHGGGYANQGYNNQGYGGYGNQGYNQGYGNQRYGNASSQADVRFSCRVNSRGQITDVNITPLQGNYRRGY